MPWLLGACGLVPLLVFVPPTQQTDARQGVGQAAEHQCSAIMPAGGRPRDSVALESLAGRYDLVLVNTRGEFGDSVQRGVLELWVNDSTRRYATIARRLGWFPGERPLAGAYEETTPAGRHPRDDRASRDRSRPGVELIGPTLFMGGIDMMDGGGERLLIKSVRTDGFWGVWHWDGGLAVMIESATKRQLANPAGHFCAWRRES